MSDQYRTEANEDAGDAEGALEEQSDTYYARPLRPLNALLINSSCRA